MDRNTTDRLELHKKTKAELIEIAKKFGTPKQNYDSANTLFGWTDDGKGVWILPATKVNFDRFEDIARSQPDQGHSPHSHNEVMRLAGAEFFADWRDSDRARAVKEQGQARPVEDKTETA